MPYVNGGEPVFVAVSSPKSAHNMATSPEVPNPAVPSAVVPEVSEVFVQ